jgi:hypothetical protein
MVPGPSAAQPPAPGRKDRGCFIALAVVGIGSFVVFVVGVILVVHFLHTDQGKATAQIVGEGFKIATQAQNAPGASAIRSAGCAQGIVMRIDDFEHIAKLASPDADIGDKDTRLADVVVSCTAPLFRTGPSCDEVKIAYFGAVPDPGGRVLVQVVATGNTHPTCSAVYERDGTFIRTLERK